MFEVTITLAILTRNRPECLRRALQAACSGESIPDEILVSDDSDDINIEETFSVVKDFSRVKYIRGPRKGLGANENHLVAHATSDWIVFNGDDARLSPDFILNLRQQLSKYHKYAVIPSGLEVWNGKKILPHRLNFFGYQSVPYTKYSDGITLETIVVQATAFPMMLMRQVRWLEVSAYGSDEVDMAYKVRKCGYKITFEPNLWVYHDSSPIGRDEYPLPTQIARLYVCLRIYSVYRPNAVKLLIFALTAPLQLAFAFARRGMWRRSAEVVVITWSAYLAWAKSLRLDWRVS